jgi:hypothetical protein
MEKPSTNGQLYGVEAVDDFIQEKKVVLGQGYKSIISKPGQVVYKKTSLPKPDQVEF